MGCLICLMEIDRALLYYAGSLREPTLNQIMLLITHLGKWKVVFIAVFLVCIFLILSKRWLYLKALLTSVLGGEFFVWIIKELVHRARPNIIQPLLTETDYSLPSGHSVIAFSFYALIIYLLYKNAKTRRLKTLFFVFGAILVPAIGFSRIYLGMHWPTDILISFAGGALWLLMIIKTFRLQSEASSIAAKPVNFKIILLLVIAGVLFFLHYFFTHPIISA